MGVREFFYCYACGHSSEKGKDDADLGCGYCGSSFGVWYEQHDIVPRRLFDSWSSAASVNIPQMATPFGGPNAAERIEGTNMQSHAPIQALQAIGETVPQGSPQICNACGYAMPTERNKPCKLCGYVELQTQPQPERPVPLQEPQMVQNTRVPVQQGPPLPSTSVTSSNFQPIAQSTIIRQPRLPAQQAGRGHEMSLISSVGVPRGQYEPHAHCLRCCFQPYPQGQRGGLWPPTVATRNAVQGVQQRPQTNVVQIAAPAAPQRIYSADPYRWQPEVCQGCCSARVPDRAVAPNVPPITPGSYELLVGNKGGGRGGGGGGGNEFLLLDETSGKAERWNLKPSATLTVVHAQGTNGANLQTRPPLAQLFRPAQQQPLNFRAPAQAAALPQAPGASGMQLPRQPKVPETTQHAANSSAVYVRLPHPSALGTSDATGPQLVQQAAMLGLSQRPDTNPAVFVRLSPNAVNVAPQSAQPQAARAFPPPVTTIGKIALEAIMDESDEGPQLQHRHTDFLNRYRKYRVRTDARRHLPRYNYSMDDNIYRVWGNQLPEATDETGPQQQTPTSVDLVQRPAAANGTASRATSPLPVSERGGSVSVATQTGQQSGRSASPAQVQTPEPAPNRELMQGSLWSILPDAEEDTYTPSRREDFSSDSGTPEYRVETGARLVRIYHDKMGKGSRSD